MEQKNPGDDIAVAKQASESFRIESSSNISGRLKRVIAGCGHVAFSAICIYGGAIGALGAVGSVEDEVGPATIEASLVPSFEGKVTANASIGEVEFDASSGPLGMDLRITSIDRDAPKQIVPLFDINDSGQFDSSINQLEDETSDVIRKAALIGIPVAVAGGLLGGLGAEALLLISRKNRSKEAPSGRDIRLGILAATLGSLVIVGASAGLTYATIDKDAWRKPGFNNYDSLSAMVDLAGSVVSDNGPYKENSARLSTWLLELINLQQNLDDTEVTEPNLVKIVAIGDEHSFPCSDELVAEIVQDAKSPVVFNVGDKSDYGQPFEATIANSECPDSNPGNIPAAIFVDPGNHDGEASVTELERYDNVTVFKEAGIKEMGITYRGQEYVSKILGEPDPFYPYSVTEQPTRQKESKEAKKQGVRLAALADIENPDYILLHRPESARQLRKYDIENNGLIITGHSHKFKYDKKRKILTVGSFASGLRGYEDESSNSLESVFILHDPVGGEPAAIQRTFVTTLGQFGGELIPINGENHP